MAAVCVGILNFGTFGNLSRRAVDFGDYGNLLCPLWLIDFVLIRARSRQFAAGEVLLLKFALSILLSTKLIAQAPGHLEQSLNWVYSEEHVPGHDIKQLLRACAGG